MSLRSITSIYLPFFAKDIAGVAAPDIQGIRAFCRPP